MKIDKLIIYGFGKHANVTVDLGPGITVFYGLNEAGKTTIQQFILHILFGFPSKNSAVLRYEPKAGGKYGGQVHLSDETYGKCIIERVGGKSAGDVTVHFDSGKKGGEEALRMILRQYDRASFEAIFSFSLLQLQGFEKMDEEELSRTLLASGTTGVDSLIQLEKRMEKEMSELFKKSGKNPEMNVKMAELRELERELKTEQDKVAEYAPAVARLQEIERDLIALRTQQKALQQDAGRLSLTQQLLPLHQKKRALEAQLSQLNAVSFPTDGVRRYEVLSDKWREAEATKRRIAEERAELAAKIAKQHSVDTLADIEILLAKEAEWHGWRMALGAAEDEWQQLKSRKSRLLGRLGVQEVERLLQANVSIQKEEEMHNLLGGLTEGDSQIGYSERQLVQLENDFMDMETKLALLAQSAPSQVEIERVQEWPQISQQLAEAKAYVALGKRREEKKSVAMPALLLLLAALCVLFGFLQQQWLVVGVGVITGVAGALLLTRKEAYSNDTAKMQQMERFIALYDGQEQQMEQLTERIALAKREKEGLQQAYASLEQKHRAVEMELDTLHDNRRQIELELAQFLRVYGLDELPSPGIIPELFRLIREVQEVSGRIEETLRTKEIVQDNIARRMIEAEQAIQKNVPQEAIYEMLRREFLRLKEEADMRKSLKADVEQKEALLKEVSDLASSLQRQLQLLLEEAGAETEEQFYSADRVHQEVGRLTEQLNDTRMQLSAHGTVELSATLTAEDVLQTVTDNEQQQSMLGEQLNTLINEQAALIHKTDRLLTDETYGHKLQYFEMKKAELAELAKQWSERKAIAEAIRRTRLELKEKKLPAVLAGAEQLFRELTGGRYESLMVTEAGRFEAISVDGMRYPIMELSQATKEQAYIALRLALAASILNTVPFPMMMDDPFVHFDGQRLSRMIEVVNQLQSKHQFIYFTCHEGMTEQWKDATIVNVSEIGSEQGAIIS